ncbi:hypothetical protein [Zhihengliuella halotolerans]|uniref:Uncharacterized protein n=1 Tax=Zhihengliuella halotolerans TaxID=370736 RepID=A0A4Q8AH64_9MICC|nr:hypothetical protein [Zhihengliuella halotolerans]RZU63115.1 hypothetical protein EV380_2724 [Zhihengliuella halotolerans]
MRTREQHSARPVPAVTDLPAAHEHGWRVESSHATSAGRVLYVMCGDCGMRRVDVQESAHVPPSALSRELP